MRKVNTFRIKRTSNSLGTVDTLQQLWMHLDGSATGIWKDVPVVETDSDHYELGDEIPGYPDNIGD